MKCSEGVLKSRTARPVEKYAHETVQICDLKTRAAEVVGPGNGARIKTFVNEPWFLEDAADSP